MIIILGTPGAGKTTQTKLLAQFLDCPWVGMGELMRQNVKGADRKAMLAGKILSDELTLKILGNALKILDVDKKECIVEGNPRSLNQAKWWVEQVKAGKIKQPIILHLVAKKQISAARMVERGRLDDHDKGVVESRFAEYDRSINDVLGYFKNAGYKVVDVDSNGSIEEVAGHVHKALGFDK